MNNIVILLGVVITLATGIPVLIQLLRNHPKGLIILFFAEMWERFSYYGMRGILIFYLTQHFLFDDKLAGATYGSYTSLVYLLPLIGGVLADRFIGTRKAVAFGAILLVLGHGLMAYEGRDATQTLTYNGQAYAVQATGRGEAREVRLVVDGKPYEFKGSDVVVMPWVQFKGAPNEVSGTDVWVIRDGKVQSQVVMVNAAPAK